jgi:hypothetical protein
MGFVHCLRHGDPNSFFWRDQMIKAHSILGNG